MNIPPITAEEEKTLRIVIADWEKRPPFKQAVAIAVIRDHDTLQLVADYLQVPVEEVLISIPYGLLLDRTTQQIHIR